MNTLQKRNAIVSKIVSRKEKNFYTQSANRFQVSTGYGDCSSTVRWAVLEATGIDIGTNTEAQIKSKKLEVVPVVIKNGIPAEINLLPGDLLYFRGTNDQRTKGVGHVEMYIGNGQICGHGSGIGPTIKSLKSYCKTRFNMASTTKLQNRGLIEIRRVILSEDATTTDELKPVLNPKTNLETMLKGYTGISIVDALESIGKDSSLKARKLLAEQVGIKSYKGSAEQNKLLIQKLGGTYK